MEISLTRTRTVYSRKKNGKYYCAGEVIRDALELLEEHDHLNQRYFEKKKEVAVGLENNDRGEGTDGEEFSKNFLKKLP